MSACVAAGAPPRIFVSEPTDKSDCMPEYPFPLDSLNDFSVWTVPTHLALLVLCVLPFIFLFRQSKRPVRGRDFWILLLAMVMALPVLLAIRLKLPAWGRPFVAGYLLFFEFGSLIALLVTVRRLAKAKQGRAIVNFLGGMLLLFLGIGLCLPAVPAAKEAARRMQCGNNLKQLMLGMLNYEQANAAFPATAGLGAGEEPVSWRVELLPWIEQEQLYAQYDGESPWNASANIPLSQTQLSAYTCPSNPHTQNEQAQWYTSYLVVQGQGAFFQAQKPVKRSAATATQFSTLGIVEACGTQVVWTQPSDLELKTYSVGVNLPGNKPHTSSAILSSYHSGGAMVTMLDGSVQFLSESTDPIVLKSMVAGQGPLNFP